MNEDHVEHEKLVEELLDPKLREEYARPFNHYKAGIIPSILGWMLMTFGDLVYRKKPSYGKFKAIEVVARIPYQSWESAAYTLLTTFYGDESHSIKLCKMSAFSRFAQDNETMHVVVVSHLCRAQKNIGIFRHWLIPLLFALVYFWIIYILYMFSHKASLELNYLFESHAYKQYQEFLDQNEEGLRQRPVMSDFLTFYGRNVRSEYEFFERVRNDELIHRNRSIHEISLYSKA